MTKKKNDVVAKKSTEDDISVKATLTGENEVNIEVRGCPKDDPNRAYKSMFGIGNEDSFKHMTNQLENSVIGDPAHSFNAVMPIMQDIAPRDALEGMLATQMVSVHNMAMEMTRRAMLSEQTVEGVNDNINRATKLMRTFTSQIETLQKYRNKGQQTIQVQHVNVNDGGQAVVGNVTGGRG